MQKSTGKELAIKKVNWSELFDETLKFHALCESARAAVEKSQKSAVIYALKVGIRLHKIKSIIPSGDWLLWVKANLPFSEQTERLYRKIASDNPDACDLANRQRVSDNSVDSEIFTLMKFDTIRKHAIAFVPEKDQPEHKGNVKLERSISFLNIANEYARLKQRHIDGLQTVDFDEMREETVELTNKLNFEQRTSCANCGAVIVTQDPWK